jgi:catechol 2,3-dioxygenase-like lactoylglutathione lyase family enzyme
MNSGEFFTLEKMLAQNRGLSDRRKPMARIRHIAIYTDSPDEVAAFYCKAFDLKEVERSPRGAIYLSDGYINVALLIPRSDSTPKGLHHFGFQVDSVEATQKWLKQIKPDIEIQQPLPGVAFAEYKIKDPEGNTFDISEKGWEV